MVRVYLKRKLEGRKVSEFQISICNLFGDKNGIVLTLQLL